MFSMFIIGLIMFLIAMLAVKVLQFVFGVLLAGSGFVIKSLFMLLVFLPTVALVVIISEGIFSTPSVFIIFVSGILTSLLSQREWLYHQK